jgi:hypothetical protein
MNKLSPEDQYQMMKGWLNERQWRLYVATEARLQGDLEEMLDPKGDPQSLVKWTSKSVRKLKEALKQKGHVIGETAIRGMVKAMGFSRHPPTRRRLRDPAMPIETRNFSTSIAPEKLTQPQGTR